MLQSISYLGIAIAVIVIVMRDRLSAVSLHQETFSEYRDGPQPCGYAPPSLVGEA